MESLDVVKFGIFDDFSHVFGTGAITNVVPLNHREMIISTTKEIIKIERNIIKMRHPIKFSTCAIVPDTDFLIGVTTKRGELVIYQIGDLPQTMQSYTSRSVNLPPPLLEDYPTNQSGIFHMIYSPKSQSIITIGAGIKVFTLQYKLSRISVIKPTVSITPRSYFAADYATTILVPPAFDTESELILLPTDEGICAFNLDGEKVMQCSKFPASLSTVYATHPSKPPKLSEIPSDGKTKKPLTMSKKLLTYDSDKGLALWGKRGQLIDQFNTIGSSVLAITFVDSENALCLNSAHSLFFLNIKTGKTFFCLNLEKNPSRIFLTFVNKQPILCACFSSYMRALKIVIPWRVWNLNIDKAFLICRCNKFRAAARVLIDAENAFIKLYSPRNGTKMTVATPAEAAHSVSYLYDRGIFEYYVFDEKNLRYDVKVMKIRSNEEPNKNDKNEDANKNDKNEDANKNDKNEEEEEINDKNNGRDILFIILENGTILGFDTNVSNCEEVMKMKCKAAFMSICRIRTFKKQRHQKQEDENNENEVNYQWCYAVASEKSDLFILDYFSMKEVRHFTVSDDKLIKMFYHFDSECIIMVFERKTIMFDLEKGKIISTVIVPGSEIATMFGNFLIYGYESGHIRRVTIENKQFALAKNKKKKKEIDDDEEENEPPQISNDNGKSNSTLQKPHDGPVTGFSFSQKIWISSGLDGNIIVWDYNFETVYKIVLPLPLKACLIMNGKRDILVATNTEVMQIKDSYLLEYFEEDPYDVEIKDIDNFDRIKDALCHDSVEAFDPDAYDNLSMSNVLSDEDEEEEKENNNNKNTKKFDLPKISNTPRKTTSTTNQPPSTPTPTNDEHKESKPSKKPAEDSKEDVQKKLEMMQAMNGLGSSNIGHQPPPSSSSTNHAASSSSTQPSSKPAESKPPAEKKKEEEPKKVTETKKKKPPKDGKELSDFINNNIENEKAQSKRKKVKKNNNQDKEPEKDEGPKKSEEEVANMIGNLFDRNKPKNQGNTNKKKTSGEGIDFNELAKKFHKDEDPLVVNLDKADLNKKKGNNQNNDDENDEADDESDSESAQKKKTSKPKQSSPSNAKPSTNSNAKPSTNSNAKPSTNAKPNNTTSTKPNTTSNTKPSTNTKQNTNTKPKEKEKDNTKSNTNAPTEKENKTSNKPKEKKPAIKANSSTKPQKESPKSTAKPQESKTNENKVNNNNSPKKVKQPTQPKTTTTAPTTTNSNPNPTSTSNTNNFSSSPAKSSTTSNLNPTNNNKTDKPNSNTFSNTSPATITETPSKTDTSPINNNNNNTNKSPINSSSNQNNTTNTTPYGQPNKISIGTQGENFDDNQNEDQGTNPNNDKNDEPDDSLHLKVKMNGPEPVSQKSPPSSSTQQIEDEPFENNEDNNSPQTVENTDTPNDTHEDPLNNSEVDDSTENPINSTNEPPPQAEETTNNNQPITEKVSSNTDDKPSEKVNHNNRPQPINDTPKRSGSENDSLNLQRAPTPPPIRPQLTSPDEHEIARRTSYKRRPRTPPPRREKPPPTFQMPPPNVVIDQEAVLVLYGRGRLEFKPLVDRIQRDMMIAGQAPNGDFYTQNRRITLAYVQNYGERMKDENENNNKFSKTAQPIVPPLTSPHRSIGHYYDPDPVQFTGDKKIFNGCTNNVSPAFKPSKTGVDFFNVTIEKAGEKDNQIRHNRMFTPDFHRAPFSPAAYVYNYDRNTETIFNDIDTNTSVTTPRRQNDGEVTTDDSIENKNDDLGEVINSKSPRRIQSARTVGRPMLSPSMKEPQVRLPLSPVVMASPRRSNSRRRPVFVDTKNDEDGEEDVEVSVDKLESAVMIKMPKLHLTSSTSTPSPHRNSSQVFQASQNVQPNFGQTQNFPQRPSSVRTFDRSPLVFNQPIGAGMMKPGSLKKRNAAFYANVAVTTSISNARRSSPAYRTGSSRTMRVGNQNNRKNAQIEGYGAIAKTPPNEIEITVK